MEASKDDEPAARRAKLSSLSGFFVSIKRAPTESNADELLVDIFCLILEPQNFSETCHRVYKISKDPWTRSKYFLLCGKNHAFYQALARGQLLTPRCIDIMISSGAKVSRYLIQSIIGHYTKTSAVKHIRGRWCRSMRYTAFAHWAAVGAARYGDSVNVLKGRDDASLIENYMVSKMRAFGDDENAPHEELEQSWVAVREAFEKFEFIPYDDKDPIFKDFTQWVSVEPRLLPLARRNGFGMLEDFREVVLRKIFAASMRVEPFSPNDEANRLAKLVLELTELDPELFLSRTLAAEICLDRIRRPHGYTALKILNRRNGLRFELSTLVADVFKLFSDSFLLYSKSVSQPLHALFREHSNILDPTIRSTLILSVFATATPALDARVPPQAPESEIHRIESARTAALQSIGEQLEEFGLLPLTKLDLINVLENRITVSEKPVVQYMEGNRHALKLSDLDHLAILENAALASLPISSKGKMLQNITADWTPNWAPLLKAAILKYDVDPEDIIEESKESSEPSVWSCLSLEENVDEDFRRKERDENDLGQIACSSLISIEEQNIRRQLDKALGNRNFTVVDWVLERYNPRSREAAIFFTQAIIGGRRALTSCQKFLRKGVPITLKHFRIAFKRSETLGPEFWRLLECQKFYASEFDYIPREEIYGEDGPDGDSSRPRKRPRREAAQTVKNYSSTTSSDLVDDSAYAVPQTEALDSWALDNDYMPYELHQPSLYSSSTLGAAQHNRLFASYIPKDERIARADQIALWIKHLADIMHVEAAKLRMRKKGVGRNDRGKPNVRTAKTVAHIELLKKLPPLRRLEAELRGNDRNNVEGANVAHEEALEDHASDEDWVDPRKKRRRRTKASSSAESPGPSGA